MNAWRDATVRLQQLQWLGMLLARLAVGLLFALSGRGKLFVPARGRQMEETLRAAGIPAPAVNARMIATIEFIFGLFLVFGFLMPLSCVMLIGVMCGALGTTVIPGIKATSFIDWLGEFLYLPETLYLVILIWLLLSGVGPVSVDHLIWTR